MNHVDDGAIAQETKKGMKSTVSDLPVVVTDQPGAAFMVALVTIVAVSLVTLHLAVRI